MSFVEQDLPWTGIAGRLAGTLPARRASVAQSVVALDTFTTPTQP